LRFPRRFEAHSILFTMVAIADGLDHISSFITGKGSKSSDPSGSGLKAAVAIVYLCFAFLWFIVLGQFSDSDFSLVMTGGAVLQCLGFVILCIKVRATKSVESLSSKTLSMFALYYCVRLTSTSMKNGYIPVDASGDFMYQLMDLAGLMCVCHLLYAIHKTHAVTYQDEVDTMPIMPLVVPSVVLAYFVHGDFNKDELYDIIWTTSLNLETLAMVPQLWMMAKQGGKVDSTMALCGLHCWELRLPLRVLVVCLPRACRGGWVRDCRDARSDRAHLAAPLFCGLHVLLRSGVD